MYIPLESYMSTEGKMKAKTIAAGLAAFIAGCAPAEIKQMPFEIKSGRGITIIHYFDGSYKIVKEEPYIEFRHNKPGNYDFVKIENTEINISITDNKCDGITEMVVIRNELGMDDVYFRFYPGKKWLFEKADKMLADAKQELGI